ncbi:YggS family pyridoxal phosphate-dependent enzyme [Streptococcus sciuri]|uniref:Pyridoxal phosphate homeostasis protein n=1 Tax=Streptococcus sciuri TaxID=2973939 RepID=A0ABT2F7Y1_9STRE|nr:YggS family pyridoxal phosphate-dependent enzyme [Streptococcus sciuri]MCS4488567.1 YggS family pyridoxal phosphate-dependent enzyme [Streptococcus sciuri]
MMNLKKNKETVFERVNQSIKAANRPADSVQIIAVTKYVDASVARDLCETGIKHIAENRVDKFLDKYETLKEKKLTWHLIGTLQRRKVKEVINYVDYFHALDSVKLAAEIQKRAAHPIKCFLQVNISEEETKHGFKVSEVEPVLSELEAFDKIELVGLMTMAPLLATKEEIADIFARAQELNQRLQNLRIPHMPFTELSMGMSGDYDIAIQKGATFVRIGSAFFKE